MDANEIAFELLTLVDQAKELTFNAPELKAKNQRGISKLVDAAKEFRELCEMVEDNFDAQ